MNNSLINKNQIREFNIPVHDNPFDMEVFGIEADEAFTPFNSEGIDIRFESQFPKEWEEKNLPVVLLTWDRWGPMSVELGGRKTNQAKLRTKNPKLWHEA